MTAHLLAPGRRVADVGCDHAHTSIYLAQNRLASRVLALDVNDGPLAAARENVSRYGLGAMVEVRKSDGLKAVSVGEVDAVLIGGLGGRLMIRILEDGERVAKEACELALQPQSDIPMVRRYLHSGGYHIMEDVIRKEEGKYYAALKAVPARGTGDRVEEYECDAHYWYGKIPLIEGGATVKEFLEYERRTYSQIRKRLIQARAHANTERLSHRLDEVEERLRMIECCL